MVEQRPYKSVDTYSKCSKELVEGTFNLGFLCAHLSEGWLTCLLTKIHWTYLKMWSTKATNVGKLDCRIFIPCWCIWKQALAHSPHTTSRQPHVLVQIPISLHNSRAQWQPSPYTKQVEAQLPAQAGQWPVRQTCQSRDLVGDHWSDGVTIVTGSIL